MKACVLKKKLVYSATDKIDRFSYENHKFMKIINATHFYYYKLNCYNCIFQFFISNIIRANH